MLCMVPVLHEDDAVHALHEAVLVDNGDSRLFPQNSVVSDHPVDRKRIAQPWFDIIQANAFFPICQTSQISDPRVAIM